MRVSPHGAPGRRPQSSTRAFEDEGFERFVAGLSSHPIWNHGGTREKIHYPLPLRSIDVNRVMRPGIDVCLKYFYRSNQKIRGDPFDRLMVGAFFFGLPHHRSQSLFGEDLVDGDRLEKSDTTTLCW